MSLQIIRNDITKVKCDAIVNAAKSTLLGGGGVDGAIHSAAGSHLLDECKTLGGCKTGQAKITRGYNLPCKYVIHTVGPVWRGGNYNEKELLESCYKNSLELAKRYNCESVAFPLISSGVYGYPISSAMDVAVDVIGSFLLENDMLVYIVVYNKKALSAGEKRFSDIAEYIDDNYIFQHTDFSKMSMPLAQADNFNTYDEPVVCSIQPKSKNVDYQNSGLESLIDDIIDESFSDMLLRKIDEKGMTDSECYKKANIDRKHFSKIRSNPAYKPSKQTTIAFAIALELSLDETNEMLMKAGFALSHSSKFDIIIEYFIRKNNYNIFEINEALFEFDQMLLGA
ncbi:MAG: O-acetyl-ADP-ribose deacetylase [Clostridiales bacterium]|nr:O-acetyl-ADP-ribose deacetylase [Clostridiales bacterium]